MKPLLEILNVDNEPNVIEEMFAGNDSGIYDNSWGDGIEDESEMPTPKPYK